MNFIHKKDSGIANKAEDMILYFAGAVGRVQTLAPTSNLWPWVT